MVPGKLPIRSYLQTNLFKIDLPQRNQHTRGKHYKDNQSQSLKHQFWIVGNVNTIQESFMESSNPLATVPTPRPVFDWTNKYVGTIEPGPIPHGLVKVRIKQNTWNEHRATRENTMKTHEAHHRTGQCKWRIKQLYTTKRSKHHQCQN